MQGAEPGMGNRVHRQSQKQQAMSQGQGPAWVSGEQQKEMGPETGTPSNVAWARTGCPRLSRIGDLGCMGWGPR